MNQENNFNTQGNNGIPNNQPLNNTNQSFNNTFNQQPINPQPQQANNYEQPIMQEPTPQPINNIESGNINNQNFSSKPPKKINIGLIIGVISLVVIVIVVGIVLLTSNKKQENNSNNGNNTNNNVNQETSKNSSIKNMTVSLSNIIALTNNNELYVYGTDNYGELGVGDSSSNVNKPTKVASDVVSFYGSGSQTYYIDSKGDLYMAGLRYTGGVIDSFEKVNSNIKDVASVINCAVVIDKNNNVQVKGPKNSYCGFTQEYEEFTQVGSNAKDVLVHYYSSGYLTNSNELYMKTDNGDSYVKTLENVKEISDTYVLTNNGEVYNIEFDGAFTKLDDNVNDINDTLYMKNDGTIYNVNKNQIEVEVNSIDDIWYDGVEFVNNVVIYKNKENKIVLHSSNGDDVIDNNLDSLKQILNYIK